MRHPIKYMLGTFLGLTLALAVVPGHAQDGAKVKATTHSILSSGIRNLRPATTSLSHCSQTTRCNSVVRTGRSTNSLYRANRNQQDRKSRTPSISSRRRPVFPLPGLVIGGRKRTRTHSRSSGKGGCEPIKQRPGGCWRVNRYRPNWPGTAGWTELTVQKIPPLVHPV